MKEITRIITIQLTEIERIEDEKILIETGKIFKEKMKDHFSLFDDCNITIQDFIRDVKE